MIEKDIHSRIIRQLESTTSSKYTVSNPLIIADIGCGDGAFTNNVISNIIIKKFNINHITKYLIDPFGNRDDDHILKLSDESFIDAFPSNHCDIIICKSVAHLFKNFNLYLFNCCRILKPNGCLYILNMSYNMDLTQQWGKYAQQSFALSLIDEATEWQKNNGNLPTYNHINRYNIYIIYKY